MVRLFCTGHMDKSAVMALRLLLILPGAMLLIGEYLCVEVAWRCLGYNQPIVLLGTVLCVSGLAAGFIDKHAT